MNAGGAPRLSWLQRVRQSPYSLPVGAIINASFAVFILSSIGSGRDWIFPAISMAVVAALILVLTGSGDRKKWPKRFPI
jgi:hypothetical protein